MKTLYGHMVLVLNRTQPTQVLNELVLTKTPHGLLTQKFQHASYSFKYGACNTKDICQFPGNTHTDKSTS